MEKKPFYKRWWFITIAVILLIGILGTIFESDEAKQEREEKYEQQEKERAEAKKEREEERRIKKEEKEAEKQLKAEKKEKEKKKAKDDKKEPESKVITQDEKIKDKIKDLAEEKASVKVNKIKVVENFSDDSDGGYNAMVHLVFDVKNRPKTAKDTINAITDSIGANLAGTEELENVTFFWEVPYIREGDNIIKVMAEHRDGNMYRVDEWYNGHYFD